MYQRTNLFHTVKAAVTTRQLAELYGLRPDRRGMVCCPFHGDKHPSMKVDTRFHCFACGADGDVIDFAARLHGLSKWDAARRIAGEVGVEPSQALTRAANKTSQALRASSPGRGAKAGAANKTSQALRASSPSRGAFGKEAKLCGMPRPPLLGEVASRSDDGEVLSPLRQYLAQMRQNKAQYAPKNPEEPLHPKFCEAVHTEAQAEQLLAELARMTPRQQRLWKMAHPEEVKRFGLEYADEQKL